MSTRRGADNKVILVCDHCPRMIKTNQTETYEADEEARRTHPDWFIGEYNFQGVVCPEHRR